MSGNAPWAGGDSGGRVALAGHRARNSRPGTRGSPAPPRRTPDGRARGRGRPALHHAARLLSQGRLDRLRRPQPLDRRRLADTRRARPDGRLSQDSPAARHPPRAADGNPRPGQNLSAQHGRHVRAARADGSLLALACQSQGLRRNPGGDRLGKNTAAGRHPRRESSAMPSSRPGRSSS